MKSLKSKVFASLAMLLVAAIMMSSASFAWYTLSTSGDVAEVDVKMEAHDGVEIAVSKTQPGEIGVGDSGDQQTWGSNATYTGQQVLKQMSQYKLASISSTAGTEIGVPYYGSDSRIESVTASSETAATYSKTGSTPELFKDNKGNLCAVAYDFWVRTNNTDPISIGLDTNPFTDGKAKMTAYLVDGTDTKGATTWKDVKTWNSSSKDAYTYTPTLDATTNYSVKHFYVYVLVDGNSVYAKDVDSVETLPAFKTTIKVTQS